MLSGLSSAPAVNQRVSERPQTPNAPAWSSCSAKPSAACGGGASAESSAVGSAASVPAGGESSGGAGVVTEEYLDHLLSPPPFTAITRYT